MSTSAASQWRPASWRACRAISQWHCAPSIGVSFPIYPLVRLRLSGACEPLPPRFQGLPRPPGSFHSCRTRVEAPIYCRPAQTTWNSQPPPAAVAAASGRATSCVSMADPSGPGHEDDLAEACSRAPKFGLNAKALILQAALAQDEEAPVKRPGAWAWRNNEILQKMHGASS